MRTFRNVCTGAAALVCLAGQALGEDIPRYVKETYPKQAVTAALDEAGALEGKDSVLTAKHRELISLAVAATVPCQYCIYYHTKAARKAGATDAELKEALAHAAQVRKWSTVLNGAMYDMSAFRKEVDTAFGDR